MDKLLKTALLHDVEQKLLDRAIKDSPLHFEAEKNDWDEVVDKDLTVISMLWRDLALKAVEDGQDALHERVFGSP